MKQLTLIRHGNAVQASHKQQDFDRLLSHHGHEEVALLGQHLKQQGFHYDQMYTSPAQRALATARILEGALPTSRLPLQVEPVLYNFEMAPLYHFIETLDDCVNHAVIVGHNPALSQLACQLLRDPIAPMPTGAALELQLNIKDWIDLTPNCAQLLTP